MKKQYRCFDWTFGQHYIYIYHDGKLIEEKKLWTDDYLDEIDRLESEDYTYGFTEKEMKEAKKRYENMLANIIGGQEINDEIEYGIIKEFENGKVLWFEPITDDSNGFVLRNDDGNIISIWK